MAEVKEVGNASVPRSPSVAVSGTNAPVDIGVQRMVSPLWPATSSYILQPLWPPTIDFEFDNL